MNKVVFACVHNAGRSQIAAAWFNQLADASKAHAVSAGTQPAERVHPEVVQAMREVGVELAAIKPQHLDGTLAAGAVMLITMGCGDECPVIAGAQRDDWPLEDPKGQPLARVREIRDQIRARVLQLLAANSWAA